MYTIASIHRNNPREVFYFVLLYSRVHHDIAVASLSSPFGERRMLNTYTRCRWINKKLFTIGVACMELLHPPSGYFEYWEKIKCPPDWCWVPRWLHIRNQYNFFNYFFFLCVYRNELESSFYQRTTFPVSKRIFNQQYIIPCAILRYFGHL